MLVKRTWFCWYPGSHYIVYDSGSELKLHFKSPCDTFRIKQKLTSIKNPQTKSMLKWVHQTVTRMLQTTDCDVVKTVSVWVPSPFHPNAVWLSALSITKHLKPPQVQLFLDGANFWHALHSWLEQNWETHTMPIWLQYPHMNKTWVKWDEKDGISTNQKACMTVILGPLFQLIQMS